MSKTDFRTCHGRGYSLLTPEGSADMPAGSEQPSAVAMGQSEIECVREKERASQLKHYLEKKRNVFNNIHFCSFNFY